MKGNSIPKATLGRLPLYLQYLKNPQHENVCMVSAASIARGLSLGEVQVRKDLAMVSGAGKPKIGYERSELIEAIEGCLGYNKLTNAVLVGAGKLGRALLDYGRIVRPFKIMILQIHKQSDRCARQRIA